MTRMPAVADRFYPAEPERLRRQVEQLMPVMSAVARASAARRETSYRHDESRFEIEIPRELVEVAQAALASEVPTD